MGGDVLLLWWGSRSGEAFLFASEVGVVQVLDMVGKVGGWV